MLKNDTDPYYYSPCLGVRVRGPCQFPSSTTPIALWTYSCLAPLDMKLSVSPTFLFPFLSSSHSHPSLFFPILFYTFYPLPLLSLFPPFLNLILQLFPFLPPLFAFFSLLLSTSLRETLPATGKGGLCCLSDDCRVLGNKDGDGR